jgi:hypothetical protein
MAKENDTEDGKKKVTARFTTNGITQWLVG